MAQPGASARRPVRVWDVPTRIGHWLFVLLIAASWWTAQNGRMELHRWSGYVILFLLVFRLWWGFAGSSTARFAGFVRGPRATWTYARGLLRRDVSDVVGHNPLGAFSVLALLLLMAAQVGLGLFSVDTDGIESGPLASWVSFEAGRWAAHWHHRAFNVLLALIGLHLAAIAFYLIWKRDNLIAPMLSGRRRLSRDAVAPRFAPPWRIAVGVVLAAAAAYAVMRGLRF